MNLILISNSYYYLFEYYGRVNVDRWVFKESSGSTAGPDKNLSLKRLS
jgi:hypothetical protein